MPDLIPPHGGVGLVERTAADVAPAGPKLVLSNADLATLYRFGDGGLSPLTGPMTREQYDRVLDEEVVVSSGKKYAWTIPLAFPATDAEAKALAPGAPATLVNEAGAVVGRLEVKDIFPWDKAKYNRTVDTTWISRFPGIAASIASTSANRPR